MLHNDDVGHWDLEHYYLNVQHWTEVGMSNAVQCKLTTSVKYNIGNINISWYACADRMCYVLTLPMR
jgi:hypothetical protein